MDGLREELISFAEQYVEDKYYSRNENELATFEQKGKGTIDLALENPNLFRFLYMGERSQLLSTGFELQTNNQDVVNMYQEMAELLGIVGYSIISRNSINYWGRRSLFVLAYGLVICCCAAARDGLDKTIQYTIDGSCNPGIFSLVSVPNIVGCIGAAIIIIAAIATPIAKSQHMREIWFYVMSSGVMLKIVVMEIARIIQMF